MNGAIIRLYKLVLVDGFRPYALHWQSILGVPKDTIIIAFSHETRNCRFPCYLYPIEDGDNQ